MTIKFYSKDVYGKMLYYLANPEQAREWARLTGRKTITGDDMTTLNKLTGVEFQRVFESEK